MELWQNGQMGILCGGYYLIKPVPRGEYMDAGLLPESILSISDCICDCISADWAIEWVNTPTEDRAAEAAKLGLGDEAFKRACTWATQALETGDFGWPNVFPNLEKARWFRAEFLPDISDIKLVGIGLPEDFVDEFLEESAPSEGQGDIGTYSVLKHRRPLEPGGRVLGFEVLGLDFQSFHSSVCNSLEKEFSEKLGVVPNAQGFITQENDARRCAEYAGLETTGSEPALWQPWQVVLYP